MRNNYLKPLANGFLVCAVFLSVSAAVNNTVHWPHNGDRVMKTHYEYVDVPADTAVWDFSHVTETGASHEMRWINLGDSLLVKIEQGTQSIFQLHGDTLVWNGYENALLYLRDSIAPIDALTAMYNGCGNSSPLCFRGRYSDNHAVDKTGYQNVLISEPGTLIFPNDTVDCAFCVTTTTDCLVRVSAKKDDAPIYEQSDSLIREVQVVKRWYSPVYRYPLAENVSCSYYSSQTLLQHSEITYLCSPAEQEYALGSLFGPEDILNNTISNNTNSNYGVLGNSSLAERVTILQETGRIDVTINACETESECSVLLCDVQGHVWHSQNGKAKHGCWQHEVNTASLTPGYYLLQIMNGSEKHVERIRIKK